MPVCCRYSAKAAELCLWRCAPRICRLTGLGAPSFHDLKKEALKSNSIRHLLQVWRKGGGFVPLALYATQLALNLAWSPIFFKKHELGFALADITGAP